MLDDVLLLLILSVVSVTILSRIDVSAVLGSYHAIGRKLDSMQRLARVNIIAFWRNGVSRDDAVVDLDLGSGDIVVVEGHPDEIQAAEIKIMTGL